MKDSVKNIVDLMMDNRTALKKRMTWELDTNTYAIMGGILTASKDVKADPELYKECKKILRSNVNIFSEIRGISEAIVVLKMMMADNSEEYIKGVVEVYKKLRARHKLTASPYMVMAAMNIYESKGLNGADEQIEQLEKLYKGLKEDHPFLVTDSDRGYLSMLINLDINVEKALADIEDNYEACKKISINKNTAYSLAQILALSTKTPEENNEYISAVLDGLKKNKKSISKQYGLTVIGALSLLGLSADEVIQEIVDVDNYIKGKPGFKWYHQGRRLRVTYAALLVFLAYSKESKLTETMSSTIAVIIAEEIILLIMIMISSIHSSNSSAS